MSLPSACGFYLNVAYLVKNSKRSSSSYLFPISQDNNSFLIPVSEALEISSKLLKKYRFQESSLLGLKSDLNSVANKDLFLRVAHSRSMGKDKDLGKEKCVSFDALAQ